MIVLIQHGYMDDKPPCEPERVLALCGEASELLCCWLP